MAFLAMVAEEAQDSLGGLALKSETVPRLAESSFGGRFSQEAYSVSRTAPTPERNLGSLDELVDSLADSIRTREAGPWQVSAAPMVGKSTVLRRLQKKLVERGEAAILLAPPLGYYDSAAVGLTQLVCQLREMDFLQDVTPFLDQRPFAEKLEELVCSLAFSRSKRPVILLDEPQLWLPNGLPIASFRTSLESLVQVLFDVLELRVVVAGEMPATREAKVRRGLSADLRIEDWLDRAADWPDSMAELVARLANEGSPGLASRTPLELRLMVGLLAMGLQSKKFHRFSRRGLAASFRIQAASSPKWRPVLETWAKLALLRTPFTESALSRSNAPSPDTDTGRVLRHCLLYRDIEDRYVLHELLRADVSSALTPDVVKETHRRWVALYREKSGGLREAPELRACEEFYHAVKSGAIEPEATPFFVEQMKFHGIVLSDNGHRGDAVRYFEQALEWEADGFSHYHLAYNLDILAKEPERVEEHYRSALRASDGVPLWWSRYICFLLARGRTSDAEHEWSKALDALLPSLNSWGPWEYRVLHGEILKIALDRSILHLASDILDNISPNILEQDAFLRTCQKRLVALKMAREGEGVVPFPHLADEWWRKGPYLLSRTFRGVGLKLWIAGRVEALGEEEIEIRTATVEAVEESRPPVLFSNFPKHLLESWGFDTGDLAPGEFVEIGVFGEDEPHYCIRKHEQVPLSEFEQELFDHFPALDRYLEYG